MGENDGVSPLRINKTPNASPSKGSFSRPLSEIGPTEHRRNSPSWNQSTKKMNFTKETSPFAGSSPFDKSPRLFWKEQTTSPTGRFGSENEYPSEASPSLLSPKRSSIENLKKASRVKNSSMFAREQKNEYDPASVQPLERPLASGRPLSTQIQGNAFGGSGLAGLRKQNDEFQAHRRGESLTKVPTRDSLSKIPTLSPTKTSPAKLPTQSTFSSPPPEEKPAPASPGKSALASPGRFNYAEFNPDSSVFSTDDEMTTQTPRPLRRHAKSVTFDAAPPTINEYEMVTPAPSTVADSRDGSYDSQDDEEDLSFDQDDSFDASLEDTEKTPVVLPEDWRHMSPEQADTSLVDEYDDVFDSREVSPLPVARPNGIANSARNGSFTSDGESRPLPPLPGFLNADNRRDSSPGLSAAAERASGRSLPSPPPAAGISKEDLLNMREVSMSLEDRLRLMNIPDDRDTQTPTQEMLDTKRDTRLGSPFCGGNEDITETEETKAPRISRESILRKVKSRNFEDYTGYEYDAEYSPDRSYGDLDPDVPIPSREASSNFDELPRETVDVREDPYSILDDYQTNEEYTDGEVSHLSDYEREGSVIHHDIKEESQENDASSLYSSQPEEQPTSQSTIETSGPSTPAVLTSSPSAAEKQARTNELFASFKESDVDLTLDPLKSSFNTALSPLDSAPKLDAMREFLRRPETPQSQQGEEVEEPSTPDSVIRHPVDEDVTDVPNVPDVPEVDIVEPSEISVQSSLDSPAIPQEFATIKGAGGKLKTRPSLIPEDVDMAATRRQVSGSHPPPVPVRSPKRESLSIEVGHVSDWDTQHKHSASNKENLPILDIDIGEDANDLSFGLDNEFDKIIEAQKKGYLMRQNTKVVVASNRKFSDEEAAEKAAKAAADLRKTSAERKPAWTTEPWNGKSRRRSIRTASGTRRAQASGPVPPLPGQESAVAGGLDSVEEQNGEEFEDGAERGRLFVKVVGVKDLDLPLPKTERTYFQLTLDNGLHCVTTSWLELGHSAPIGQEFELVVLDDLEFQLTLQTKLEAPPKPTVTAAPVAPKEVAHKKSSSAFRNLLSSPKKRKEAERKQQEEAQRLALQQQQQREAQEKRKPQTAWDLLHNLVGPDGSFARAYVCLKNHENEAYGRPLTVDIPCFNEWAVDDTVASSVKSKRGGIVRRPPYRVGKLTLQLLYVPKPKNAKDEDMPKSMNACIRELKEAEQVKSKQFEGFLSQQGGDCPYWRRRWFRLDGTKLTAYHETTRQPRATISLAKASKLIDDKTALQQPASTKSGGRRKSAFAEEEEGYMFVEEGFRIRFANGEVIDFYADTTAQKDEWMAALSETIGKDLAGSKAWTAMVFDKERKDKKRQTAPPLSQPTQSQNAPSQPQLTRPQSHEGYANKSAPTSPMKSRNRGQSDAPYMSGALKGHARTQSDAPATHSMPTKGHSRTRSDVPQPIEKDMRHKAGVMPRKQVGDTARRDQVRSMMF